MTDDERRKLVSTEQSLSMDVEPRMPSNIAGLETFTLGSGNDDSEHSSESVAQDAESLFNLPDSDDEDDDEDDRR